MYIEGIFTQETTENMKNDFMKVLEEYINSIKILKINIENSDNTINKHIRNNILESIKETYNTFRLFLNNWKPFSKVVLMSSSSTLWIPAFTFFNPS